ncbi:hypothetical protein G9U51_06285 [Calidifontibacter sp. DB0510]|uniref:Lipoprotein n=1 Tax=Metallococcus carri TaxID=1656884 RepID=A0A967B663_9MICO|nr:hypothetical protein [Metallococcus carri]NHN55391.1 hypothetical protein [Metallococcus carri]NOP36468.1 hypothetical protein [Calidifontibacter sp. DB2511S]
MNTSLIRRVAAAGIVAATTVGMTACNSDNTVTEPSSTSSSTTSSSSSSSETSSDTSSSETSSDTSSSDTSSDSSSSDTSSDSSSDSSSTADSGPTDPSAKDASFSFGQPAVIADSSQTFRLTVKSLKKAPDSVYSSTSLKKEDGTVYFIDYEVTPLKFDKFFSNTTVNGLFLYPTFDSSQKAKRLYGDAPGCSSESKELKVGETGSACYVYQVTGKEASTVTYNNYTYRLTWK